ncbi:hypothetical protein X975_00965, partial [Stegodyphus mimosarum]
MALRRFFARRGRINIIYTDTDTNFIGSNNALRNLDWEKIMSFSTIKKIKWNFNRPTAAWFGGSSEKLPFIVQDAQRDEKRVSTKISLRLAANCSDSTEDDDS